MRVHPATVSAKIPYAVNQKIKTAIRDHPEKFRDNTTFLREAILGLLEDLGYTDCRPLMEARVGAVRRTRLRRKIVR
jgi:hypothetical protein